MDIYEQIINLSKQNPKRILFDEIKDRRILKASIDLSKNKIVKVKLLGERKKIKEKAKEFNLNLEEDDFLEIIEIDESLKKRFIKEYYDMKKDKHKITLDDAKKALEDELFYASFLLKHNIVDGIVSGSIHPTARTLKAAFSIIGTKEGIRKASSYFIIPTEEKIFFFADCAVNINPNEEELAEIAILTAKSAQQYNITPKVALLSFSTKGSAKHPLVDKVRKATEIAKQKEPNIIIDGELQLDAAIVKEVARLKCPDSPLQGNANVLIFPNLEAGNIGYKLVQRFANLKAIGPIIQGLNKPVNDLSRGCSVDEIVYVAAITSIQAQNNNQ